MHLLNDSEKNKGFVVVQAKAKDTAVGDRMDGPGDIIW